MSEEWKYIAQRVESANRQLESELAQLRASRAELEGELARVKAENESLRAGYAGMKSSSFDSFVLDKANQLIDRVKVLESDLAEAVAAGLKLCQELQSPAMEYLNEHVQKAWSELFAIVEKHRGNANAT